MNEMRVASIAFAVLPELGARAIHQHDRRAGPGERRVELGHQLGALGILGANDDAIRLQKVVDGGALFQELRVTHHAEGVVVSRRSTSLTFAAVPTGTVLLLTMTL